MTQMTEIRCPAKFSETIDYHDFDLYFKNTKLETSN